MIIFLIVGAVLVLWGISTYNKLVRGKVQVEEAFSTMDVYLKKRFDQIPNIVATVKGYAKHEAETLENVVKLRNSATTIDEKIEADAQLTSAVKGLMVQVEAYPELKANTNFLELQRQLVAVEQDIANARKYYNGCVREFNNSVLTVPTNIIANMFGFGRMKMYEVNDASERNNVEVKF